MGVRAFAHALSVVVVIVGAVLLVLVEAHAIAHALLIGAVVAIALGVIAMIGAVVINE